MQNNKPPVYRGRFAPSPTGPLHFGSLVAALGSFLDARAHQGEWLVRIEDLDPPREVPGATQRILDTLDAFGLYPDGDILYQSQRESAYQAALDRLETLGFTFPCACSRRELQQHAGSANTTPVYPGTCRNGLPPGRAARATRARVPARDVRFRDRLQGEVREWLPTTCGDFILKRADGLFAYQLAVVVDDALQGITHVVRGADLLDSTPRQILLNEWLGYPVPAYLHLPVATNRRGEKLSKQTHAAPLDPHDPVAALWEAARFLGQSPPRALRRASPGAFWGWILEHWTLSRVAATRTLEHC